jgi:hypothetical protein
MKPAPFVDRPSDREPMPDWSDTLPACFRSEAFAEDLTDGACGRASFDAAATASMPRSARPRRWPPLWGATLALIGRRAAPAR